jgi:kynureninase
MDLADVRLASLGVVVGTPRESSRRGGHVALEHPRARQLAQALPPRGVVVDFREPNSIRLAPVALYTSFVDVWRAVETVRDILASGALSSPEGAA